MALMKFREPNQVKWIGSRPGHNGTQVLASTNADSALATVYLVPVGKTFYLCYAGINYSAVAAGMAYMDIRDDGGVRIAYLYNEVIIAAGEGKAFASSFWPPIELLAGYTVRLASGAAGLTVHGVVHGWYEPPP